MSKEELITKQTISTLYTPPFTVKYNHDEPRYLRIEIPGVGVIQIKDDFEGLVIDVYSRDEEDSAHSSWLLWDDFNPGEGEVEK